MNSGLFLADIGPDIVGPAFGCMMILGIVSVSVLTRHQRKMAELIHGHNPQTYDQNAANAYQNQQMMQEMARLSNAVSALTVTVDNLKDQMERNSNVADRVNTNVNS